MPSPAPSIAVIIPTRNRSQLVRRAIESIRRQTVPASEIIVVDDGSTDDTGEQLRALQSSVNQLHCISQPGIGAAAARNAGASRASSEILLFLDSDDQLVPEAVAVFTEAFSQPDAGAACTAARFVDANGHVTRTSYPRNLGAAFERQEGLFLAGTFAVRRDVFESLGGFAPACRSSQHTEFALRLVPFLVQNDFRLVTRREVTVEIHVHEDEHLRGNARTLLEGAEYIISRHERQLRKSPKYFSDWCMIAAVYAAKTRQFHVTRRYLWKAVIASPHRPGNFARLAIACFPPLARQVWRPDTIR